MRLIIDLNIKIARFKFKKPGETNYSLWIMLVKPIQRVKLTFFLNMIKPIIEDLLII